MKKEAKTFATWRFALLGAALAVAGCSKGHVETTAAVQVGPLPPPAHVVVTDFTISPSQVQVDNGIGAQLRRGASGEDTGEAITQAEQEAQAALTDTLTKRLAEYGLPVERLPASVMPPQGSLLVQGQIVSINQGNRTRRVLIGLGAGKSSITANAQLYYLGNPASPQFLQSFTGTADSGRMPGAAETMGAGAAADRLATSGALTVASHAGAEMYRTGDAANAAKLAEALAKQIGGYAEQQAWIAAGSVK